MLVSYDASCPTFAASGEERDIRGSVVSVGVFDGVHLGHQAILAANVACARARNLRSAIVTFGSHPKELLLGQGPRTLTSLEHRLEFFRRAGIDHTLALTFDEELRSLEPGRFLHKILLECMGAECFVLGFDSKFGRDRAGDPAFLERLGYDVQVVPKVSIDQRAVSSTAIREAIELGDLPAASRMLGRLVSVYGEIVAGAQLGKTLGFPTANLNLHHELHPPVGVYACRARLSSDSEDGIATQHLAVTNIGFRPTVAGERPPAPLVETHLLDDLGDLYGRHLEVEFVERIRGEQRFDSLDELRAQIAQDIRRGREILAHAE